MKRFQYGYSNVYEWCVYDAERQFAPAYDACCKLLPQVDGRWQSPVLLPNKHRAMSLCRQLNVAWKRSQEASGEVAE